MTEHKKWEKWFASSSRAELEISHYLATLRTVHFADLMKAEIQIYEKNGLEVPKYTSQKPDFLGEIPYSQIKRFVNRYKSESLKSKDLARYHAKLRKKYAEAARRPWLPIPLDPPEPW